MAKNYTKTQAKRAMDSIKQKLMKLYVDGYISLAVWTKTSESLTRASDKMK
jgi:hypothetical protein|tara:strand:- start:766 stop:918 length:153 start_codon:yes stop_codon:yes gene_type:complete